MPIGCPEQCWGCTKNQQGIGTCLQANMQSACRHGPPLCQLLIQHCRQSLKQLTSVLPMLQGHMGANEFCKCANLELPYVEHALQPGIIHIRRQILHIQVVLARHTILSAVC